MLTKIFMILWLTFALFSAFVFRKIGTVNAITPAKSDLGSPYMQIMWIYHNFHHLMHISHAVADFRSGFSVFGTIYGVMHAQIDLGSLFLQFICLYYIHSFQHILKMCYVDQYVHTHFGTFSLFFSVNAITHGQLLLGSPFLHIMCISYSLVLNY